MADDEKRVDSLVPGDVFSHRGTGVLVLERARTDVEVTGPLVGRACLKVRGRRMDTLAEGDVSFGPEASVRLVMTSVDLLGGNPVPEQRRVPKQHGSSRPSEWPAR